MRTQGFTLLELTIASSITVVVSLLSFVAVKTSLDSANQASVQETVQRNVHDALRAMSQEIQMAASTDSAPMYSAIKLGGTTDLPEVTFQTPLDMTGTTWSTPITYRFVNEDTNCNGVRDASEADTDGDGVLTRRIVRVQDGVAQPIAAANEISAAAFTLSTDKKTLTITLTASKSYVSGKAVRQAMADASERAYLLN